MGNEEKSQHIVATMHKNAVIVQLDQARKNFVARLPKGIDPDKFFLGVLTAIQKSKNNSKPGQSLADCDPRSVLLAAYEAAELGCDLSPALQLGWLINYGGQAQFQPSYRFFIQKAWETGEIKRFFAEVVYKDDPFEREFAPSRVLIHKPAPDSERTLKARIGAYAYIEFKDGTVDWEYLSSEQIDRHRNKSKQPNSMKWTEFWEEGWRITPIRVLAKRLPLKGMEGVVELANRSEEVELNLDAESIMEPTAPRRAEVAKPAQAKEQSKEEAAPAETQEAEPAETKEQPAQSENMFSGGEEQDPFITPEDITAFWPKAFEQNWKKPDVSALIKTFGVDALKDMRRSQFKKLTATIAAGKK